MPSSTASWPNSSGWRKPTAWPRPDSPTQRVGAQPLDKFETVNHRQPMLSLENAFSEAEVCEFDERLKRFLKTAG